MRILQLFLGISPVRDARNRFLARRGFLAFLQAIAVP